MNTQFTELKKRLNEIQDLTKISSVLGWDQQVLMPSKGAAARAEQMATVGRIIHEKFTSPEVGRLLDELRPYEESLPYDSDEASLIRVARRDYAKATRIPTELRVEMTRTSSLAHHAWVEARKQSDFASFLPWLQKQIDLRLKYVECFDETDTPYDVLLDDYERDMKTSEVKQIFDDLKRELVPLIAAVAQHADRVSDKPLYGHFPTEQQRAFCVYVIKHFGFSEDSWRLDPTVHPFASGSAIRDIRITTRYYEDFLSPAVFGSMHECGHGLYENGVSTDLERTLLARGTSLGMHESQSRLWENLVGRSHA
ncbi:MAG: carboxypeptidase M32, partial [Chloroflexi bacterium]|nr:carboxypeptidase M32 [Chloroflexota bacterium]